MFRSIKNQKQEPIVEEFYNSCKPASLLNVFQNNHYISGETIAWSQK